MVGLGKGRRDEGLGMPLSRLRFSSMATATRCWDVGVPRQDREVSNHSREEEKAMAEAEAILGKGKKIVVGRIRTRPVLWNPSNQGLQLSRDRSSDGARSGGLRWG